MSDIEYLHNIVRREVMRALAQHSPQSRIGTVSSYDPEMHSVKVMLQPENKESNWIPIAVDHMGSGFGVVFAPEIGDQMEISFHQNDPSSARVTGRYHSEQDKPPRVESGEMLLKHKSGAQILFNKKGEIIIHTPRGKFLVNQGDKR